MDHKSHKPDQKRTVPFKGPNFRYHFPHPFVGEKPRWPHPGKPVHASSKEGRRGCAEVGRDTCFGAPTWGLEEMRLLAPWGGLRGVWFFGIARFLSLERPSFPKKCKCVYYSGLYYVYIYIHVYHDYLLYYNMSKFIFVTCIFDASICLLILSIHTFVCLLFCLSKVVGFPKLVNSSQVKPVDMYFFQKASQMNSFMSSTIL